MDSKLTVFLGIFLASVFLMSSGAAARGLATTSNDTSNEVNGAFDEAKYHGGLVNDTNPCGNEGCCEPGTNTCARCCGSGSTVTSQRAATSEQLSEADDESKH